MVPVASRVGLFTLAFLAVSAVPLLAADAAQRRELLSLNNITGNDAIDAKTMLLIKGGEKTRKLLKLAETLAGEKDSPFNYNALYILARAAQELKEADPAELFYRAAAKEALQLQSGEKLVQSLGGLIDLFFENKKYDETVQVCREFLAIEENDAVNRLKPAIVERMIQSLTRQKKVDQAMKLVDNLVKTENEAGGWWFLQLKGWVLRETERFDEAAKTYESVLERMGKDENLEKEEKDGLTQGVRYILSNLYTELDQVDKAVEQLEILLKEKPDDPACNNDLGYLWANHDLNLEDAEKLIRKALAEDRKLRQADPELAAEDDKDDPGMLDSLGWVLYKQKQYEEARKYLLQAVSDKDGKEIEILDHLGEVHLALEEKDEARKVFREAIEAAGPSKRDQQRKTEIENKLQMLDE